MKIKTYALLFFALLTIPHMTGCDTKNADDSALAASDAQKIDVQGIPNDVQKSLQAALDAEPINIPAEEWTIETLCQASYINGKNLKIPCTLRDLGEGFAVLEDDSHLIVFSESSGRAGGHLTYYGTYIGSFSVKDCDSKEKISDSPIIMLDLVFDEFKENEIAPFSCNGFGFGETKEMMFERLYFMDVYQESQERNYCVLVADIEDMHLICNYSQDKLKNFTVVFESYS